MLSTPLARQATVVITDQLPIALIKSAVLTYWHGQGTGTGEVWILNPDRTEYVATSNPGVVDLSAGGFTHNPVVFVNFQLPQEGTYWVQIMLDFDVVDEAPFAVVLHQHEAVDASL